MHGKDNAFEDAFGKFDFGFSGFLGLQLHKTRLTVGYDYGFVDIINVNGWNTNRYATLQNKNLKISLSQFF